MKIFSLAVLAIALGISHAQSPAPPAPAGAVDTNHAKKAGRCSDPKHIVTLSATETGRTMEGPVCAQVFVDVLRYSAYLGKKYQAPSAGANLSSVLPSAFSPGGKYEEPEKGKKAAPPSLQQEFKAIEDEWNQKDYFGNWNQREINNRKAATSLSETLVKLQNEIMQIDAEFNQYGAKGPAHLIESMKGKTFQSLAGANVVTKFQNDWKNSDDLIGRLEGLQERLSRLPLDHPVDTGTYKSDEACSAGNIDLLGWASWDKCYDAQYKAMQSLVTNLLNDANQWTSDSTNAKQYDSNLNLLNFWSERAAALNDPEYFKLKSDVPCPVLFNQNQAIEVDLYTTDETTMFPGQTAQQNPTGTALLTVNCSSAFAVSAGAAFSMIKSPAYTIVQAAPPSGSTTPVSQVAVSSNSAINPYPIALAHARLQDWGENHYALHATFGIGVNPNAGGSTAPDFLTGLSLSFLRTMFVTAGLDVGKQSKLAGGYTVGSTAPSGVNPIPTSSSYTGGFGFAISFTKP